MTATHLLPVSGETPRWPLAIEGLLIAAVGLAAVLFPVLATFAVTIFVGWSLLALGVVRAVGAFQRPAGERLGAFAGAGLSLAVAALVLWQPLAGIVSLTLLIAAYLLVEGALFAAQVIRPRGKRPRAWPLAALAAVLDWLLAGFLVVFLPSVAAWTLGVIVGVSWPAVWPSWPSPSRRTGLSPPRPDAGASAIVDSAGVGPAPKRLASAQSPTVSVITNWLSRNNGGRFRPWRTTPCRNWRA